jgi:L-rhamnose mutarotase
MKRYCLALDLEDDATLIAEYEHHHRHVWPQITEQIRRSGILAMTIYRTGNRLCMTIETEDDFSWEKKATADAASEVVQQWESLMWKYQQPLPWANPGEKWVLMQAVFEMK